MNPILLLHGALGAKDQLLPLKRQLEHPLSKIHTINFSGHGGQSFRGSQFGIESFAADVLDFMNNNHISKINVFGYSMGGYVATWLALKNPDRVDRIITLGTKFDWSPESAQKEVRKLNVEKITEKVPAFARLLEKRHAPVDWRELIMKTCGMMTDLGANPLLNLQNVGEISHKIMILLGDEDDMADLQFSRDVAKALPNGTFKALAKTPHLFEKVDVVRLSALIPDFLKD